MNEIGQKIAEIPLKAAAAFVWPLMVKATKQTENGCRQAICTQNLNKIGQIINGRDTFKGHCSLCLTFEGKDYVINRAQLPIRYLHAKFEQNRSIDGRDIAYLVFQGCWALFKGT